MAEIHIGTATDERESGRGGRNGPRRGTYILGPRNTGTVPLAVGTAGRDVRWNLEPSSAADALAYAVALGEVDPLSRAERRLAALIELSEDDVAHEGL